MKFPPFAMASGEKKRPSPTGDAEDSDKRVKAGIETNDDNIDKMIDLQGEMEIAKVAEEEDFSMTADELEFNPATLSSSSGLSSSSSTSSPRAPPSVPPALRSLGARTGRSRSSSTPLESLASRLGVAATLKTCTPEDSHGLQCLQL